MTDASKSVYDIDVNVARTAPDDATAVGYAIASKGGVPRAIGFGRKALEANGFSGKVGEVLVIPGAPAVVAIGIGDAAELDRTEVRNAAAAFVRKTAKHERVALNLADVVADAGHIDADDAAALVAEGALLAAYRYVGLKNDDDAGSKLAALTLTSAAKRSKVIMEGAARGRTTALAGALARELANTPPSYLNAKDIAARAETIAVDVGLEVEVFNADQLEAMGCGGIIGVNRGSTEPPRMVKLTYDPPNATGHLALVGKGVMYDSGGISLKPSDPMHAVMKMDMSGAAAVLAAMSSLPGLGCTTKVTAWLMCTDNMPSGSALKLGDVLTMRNGKTVEIHNTDAEGRLILADGLSLAVEESPDAIVDIATLTGACLVALGPGVAGVLGTNQGLVDQLRAVSEATDEPIWQLPLEAKRYRKLLDSVVADMRNIGGPYGGTITAAIFLSEFVGEVPWAHLDIAGPMKVDADEGILTKGATGFGARLLTELACTFTPPA